jgi:hypothetical protein
MSSESKDETTLAKPGHLHPPTESPVRDGADDTGRDEEQHRDHRVRIELAILGPSTPSDLEPTVSRTCSALLTYSFRPDASIAPDRRVIGGELRRHVQPTVGERRGNIGGTTSDRGGHRCPPNLALEQPPLTIRVLPQLKLIASHPGGHRRTARRSLAITGARRADPWCRFGHRVARAWSANAVLARPQHPTPNRAHGGVSPSVSPTPQNNPHATALSDTMSPLLSLMSAASGPLLIRRF